MSVLSRVLPEQNVEGFGAAVDDYNDTVERTSLTDGFAVKVPEYDMAAISERWSRAKGNYIGANCRITAYSLLKGTLGIPTGDSDDFLLFLDRDAIASGGLLTEEEYGEFKRLFSRVKTEKTGEVRVHAKKMRGHFAGFQFNEKAKMVAVIVHDNLDGDFLFIGHVGVLTENGEEFLFVEKLSFEEPYQALKFQSEDDCYRYLLQKYEAYSDEGAAKPFLMVNGEFTEPE